MSSITQTTNGNLREFAELLKYELKIEAGIETVVDSIKYMEKRGFKIYKENRY